MNFAKGFLLLIAPIAPLTFSVGVSPSLAATLGSSEATVTIDNFSHNPLDVLTLTETSTNTFASNGLVNAQADAVAAFIPNPAASAFNASFSQVNGSGQEYFGVADSTAAVIGYNFSIGKGETFSFNFNAALDMATFIDDPQFEASNATGSIALQLFDTTDKNNWIALDIFTLSGNLATLEDNDFLNYDVRNNVSLDPKLMTFETRFGGTQESIKVSTGGIFSRTFDDLANLTLVEVKTNHASVSVPEPSSFLGLLLCLIGMGYKVTSKAFRAK